MSINRQQRGARLLYLNPQFDFVMRLGNFLSGISNLRPVLAVALAVLLAGCGGQERYDTIEGMREKFNLTPPTPQSFIVCHENGCTERTKVTLSEAQWAQVRAKFQPKPRDADEERARIADAVGLLERLVAPQAGTAGDVGGTFEGIGRSGQMDCEDEASNTTQYLVMMKNDGLLAYNTPIGRRWRGFFIHGWPHTTAVVSEAGTGTQWAIDSWFEDNGIPAHVVLLATWEDGWSPKDKTGPQYEKPVGDKPVK